MMRNLIVFSLLFTLGLAGFAQQSLETNVAFLRGKDQIRNGEYQKAIQQFDQVISEMGEQAEVFAFRAKAKLFSGDAKGGNEDLAKAVALDNSSRNVLYISSEMKGTMGDLSGALKDLNSLLTGHPDDIDALMIRASYLKMKGMDAEACADWKKAEQLGSPTAKDFSNRMCK
ncbi:MAG: hypothetical protein H6581_27480 [Bacteroidia bacterium]|nr:hypothetical protein [Bacteroidia bacterium]